MRLAFTENLSADGVFLRTGLPPSPGTGIRLLIRTGHGSEARRGVVVWARISLARRDTPALASGVGIRFLPRA